MGNGSSGSFVCHDNFYRDRADIPLYGILNRHLTLGTPVISESSNTAIRPPRNGRGILFVASQYFVASLRPTDRHSPGLTTPAYRGVWPLNRTGGGYVVRKIGEVKRAEEVFIHFPMSPRVGAI